MLEKYYKILNHENLIEEKLDTIINAYVDFYGEEKREYITNKFRNTTYITYLRLEDLNIILLKMKKIKTSELLDKIRKELNDYFNDEEFRRLFNESCYDNSIVHEYYSFTKKVLNGEDVKTPYFLSFFDSNINKENILSGNFDEKMKMLNKIKPLIDDLNIEYNEFLISIEKEENAINEANKLKEKLEKEALVNFVNEFKAYLKPSEYEQIMNIYQKSGNIFMNLSKKLELMYGYSINTESLMESFSEINNEKLNNGLDYEKEVIIKNRIKYFKECGIDLGSDYNNYLNDERCKELIPNLELVSKIGMYKEKTKEKIKKQIDENYYDYISNKYKFHKNSIYNEEDLDAFYREEVTCVCPDIINVDNKMVERPMVFINMANDPEILDANIIHEFNHLYELIYNYNGDRFSATFGWDYSKAVYDPIKCMYVDDEADTSKRKYELFNEIMNDLISQTICKRMHNNGNNIITETGKVKLGCTGYQKTSILVNDFIGMYKNEIIESRSNNKIDIIYDKVGRDNFEELNDLFNEFNEYLGGLNFLRCMQELHDGMDTNLTRKFREIEVKRDNILQNMNNYSLAKQNKAL